MTDHLTVRERSWNMSRIRGKDTKPEIAVRSLLHHLGYRFRLHRRDLPGNPDIVLPKYKTVVFVHGCLWHRHKNCKYAYNPKSRIEFWQKKLRENVDRDKKNQKALSKKGWKIVVVWECELRDMDKLVIRLAKEMAKPISKSRKKHSADYQ